MPHHHHIMQLSSRLWHILVVKNWNCLSFCLSLHVCLLVFLCIQILACGFIKSLVVNHCWLIQLFSLACTIKGYTKRIESKPVYISICCMPACLSVIDVLLSPYISLHVAEQQSSKQCELPSDEAGIIWDGVCFCFLLLQRRVFRSHYFLYVVLDLQNTQLLASRYTITQTHILY